MGRICRKSISGLLIANLLFSSFSSAVFAQEVTLVETHIAPHEIQTVTAAQFRQVVSDQFGQFLRLSPAAGLMQLKNFSEFSSARMPRLIPDQVAAQALLGLLVTPEIVQLQEKVEIPHQLAERIGPENIETIAATARHLQRIADNDVELRRIIAQLRQDLADARAVHGSDLNAIQAKLDHFFQKSFSTTSAIALTEQVVMRPEPLSGIYAKSSLVPAGTEVIWRKQNQDMPAPAGTGIHGMFKSDFSKNPAAILNIRQFTRQGRELSELVDPVGHILLFRVISQKPARDYKSPYPISYSLSPHISLHWRTSMREQHGSAWGSNAHVVISEQNVNSDGLEWQGWSRAGDFNLPRTRFTIPAKMDSRRGLDEVLVHPAKENIVAFLPINQFVDLVESISEQSGDFHIRAFMEALIALSESRQPGFSSPAQSLPASTAKPGKPRRGMNPRSLWKKWKSLPPNGDLAVVRALVGISLGLVLPWLILPYSSFLRLHPLAMLAGITTGFFLGSLHDEGHIILGRRSGAEVFREQNNAHGYRLGKHTILQRALTALGGPLLNLAIVVAAGFLGILPLIFSTFPPGWREFFFAIAYPNLAIGFGALLPIDPHSGGGLILRLLAEQGKDGHQLGQNLIDVAGSPLEIASPSINLLELRSKDGTILSSAKVPLITYNYHGRRTVAIYRVLGTEEYKDLTKTGRFSLGKREHKGFSLFWTGSVSEDFYKMEQLRGLYPHAIVIYVAREFFDTLLEDGNWKAPDMHATLSGHRVLKKGSVLLLRNRINVPVGIGADDIFDEMNLNEKSLPFFNQYILGIERLW